MRARSDLYVTQEAYSGSHTDVLRLKKKKDDGKQKKRVKIEILPFCGGVARRGGLVTAEVHVSVAWGIAKVSAQKQPAWPAQQGKRTTAASPSAAISAKKDECKRTDRQRWRSESSSAGGRQRK